MNNRYPQTPDMIPPPGMPRDQPYKPTPMPTSNPLYPSGVGFAPNMSALPYLSTAFTSGNPSNSSYPASSSPYLLAPNNSYPVFTSPYPASSSDIYPVSSLSYPTSSNIPYPASALSYLASSNKDYAASSNSRYSTSCNSPYPAPTSAYPYNSNRHYPASNSSYPAPPSINQPPGPSMRSRDYDSKFGPNVSIGSAGTMEDFCGIAELKEIIEKVNAELNQSCTKIAELNAKVREQEECLSTAQTEMSNLREENAQAQTEMSNLREENAQAQTEMSNLREENAQAQTEISNLREENAQLASRLKEVQDCQGCAEDRIKILERVLREKETELIRTLHSVYILNPSSHHDFRSQNCPPYLSRYPTPSPAPPPYETYPPTGGYFSQEKTPVR